MMALYELDYQLSDTQKKVLFNSLKTHNAKNILEKKLDEEGEKELREIALAGLTYRWRLLTVALLALKLALIKRFLEADYQCQRCC